MQDEYHMPKEKKITFDFSRFEKPKSKANSERASLIEPFVTKLNNSRVAGGYKKLPASYFAAKMAHIKTEDLYAFYKKLEDSANFGGLWYYYCVPKSCKKNSGKK